MWDHLKSTPRPQSLLEKKVLENDDGDEVFGGLCCGGRKPFPAKAMDLEPIVDLELAMDLEPIVDPDPMSLAAEEHIRRLSELALIYDALESRMEKLNMASPKVNDEVDVAAAAAEAEDAARRAAECQASPAVNDDLAVAVAATEAEAARRAAESQALEAAAALEAQEAAKAAQPPHAATAAVSAGRDVESEAARAKPNSNDAKPFRIIAPTDNAKNFPGIAFRGSANLEDKTGDIAKWGTTILGVNQMNGWIQVTSAETREEVGRYLPMSVQGERVIAPDLSRLTAT